MKRRGDLFSCFFSKRNPNDLESAAESVLLSGFLVILDLSVIRPVPCSPRLSPFLTWCFPEQPSVRHASFAQLPLDTTGEHVAKTPWWRKLFPKKKAMTRSFTMEDLKKDLSMVKLLLFEEVVPVVIIDLFRMTILYRKTSFSLVWRLTRTR